MIRAGFIAELPVLAMSALVNTVPDRANLYVPGRGSSRDCQLVNVYI